MITDSRGSNVAWAGLEMAGLERLEQGSAGARAWRAGGFCEARARLGQGSGEARPSVVHDRLGVRLGRVATRAGRLGGLG